MPGRRTGTVPALKNINGVCPGFLWWIWAATPCHQRLHGVKVTDSVIMINGDTLLQDACTFERKSGQLDPSKRSLLSAFFSLHLAHTACAIPFALFPPSPRFTPNLYLHPGYRIWYAGRVKAWVFYSKKEGRVRSSIRRATKPS